MFYQSFIIPTPDSLHGCRDGIIKRDLIKTKQASRIMAPHSWICEIIGQGLLLYLTSSRSSFRWWRTQMLRRGASRGLFVIFNLSLMKWVSSLEIITVVHFILPPKISLPPTTSFNKNYVDTTGNLKKAPTKSPTYPCTGNARSRFKVWAKDNCSVFTLGLKSSPESFSEVMCKCLFL